MSTKCSPKCSQKNFRKSQQLCFSYRLPIETNNEKCELDGGGVEEGRGGGGGADLASTPSLDWGNRSIKI